MRKALYFLMISAALVSCKRKCDPVQTFHNPLGLKTYLLNYKDKDTLVFLRNQKDTLTYYASAWAPVEYQEGFECMSECPCDLHMNPGRKIRVVSADGNDSFYIWEYMNERDVMIVAIIKETNYKFQFHFDETRFSPEHTQLYSFGGRSYTKVYYGRSSWNTSDEIRINREDGIISLLLDVTSPYVTTLQILK